MWQFIHLQDGRTRYSVKTERANRYIRPRSPLSFFFLIVNRACELGTAPSGGWLCHTLISTMARGFHARHRDRSSPYNGELKRMCKMLYTAIRVIETFFCYSTTDCDRKKIWYLFNLLTLTKSFKCLSKSFELIRFMHHRCIISLSHLYNYVIYRYCE